MHRTKEYIIECADPDCTARVRTTSHRREKLCPACKAKHQAAYQERARRRAEEDQTEQYDPDVALDRKLQKCQYAIQYDAAPEEESFPKGARMTRQELLQLLRDESIHPGSLVQNLKTQQVKKVIRTGTGRLQLQPISPTQLGSPPSP